MTADVTSDGASFGSLVVPLTPAQRSAATSGRVIVGVRPESLHARGEGGLDVTVHTVEELGSESYLYCAPLSHPDVTVVSRTEGLSSVQAGDTVHLVPDHGAVHLFDAATGERLPD